VAPTSIFMSAPLSKRHPRTGRHCPWLVSWFLPLVLLLLVPLIWVCELGRGLGGGGGARQRPKSSSWRRFRGKTVRGLVSGGEAARG